MPFNQKMPKTVPAQHGRQCVYWIRRYKRYVGDVYTTPEKKHEQFKEAKLKRGEGKTENASKEKNSKIDKERKLKKKW